MTKVFFASIHPAPYVDTWIQNINGICDLTVAYNYRKSAAKTWNNYVPTPGICYEDIGIITWLKSMLRCDYIILSGWHEKINILSLIIAKIFCKKVAVFSDHPYEVKKYSIPWWKKKIILSLVPNIFCATHSTINYYHKTFGYKDKNLYFFPYAYDQEIPDLSKYNEERNIQISSGSNIKLFVANNFRERKGYKCLYESLKELSRQGLLNKFEITIAGSGEEFEYYSSLLHLLSKEIQLLGWIDNDVYSKQMAETDIFVHASNFEPFSIPPIDAMKRGKLLIASDGVKSTEQLLDNGINGFCFKSGNSSELAAILSRILDSPSIIYKCGNTGKKDVDKMYNNQIYVNTLKKAIYVE